jgi:ribosome biogenesis protein ERB1
MVTLTLKNVISKVFWHPKGDYLATMAHNIQSTSQVLIHSISKASSQKPFSTTKGIIQAIAFHPSKPHFFACTQSVVFQYNLQKQTIVNKYKSGAKWISSICIHPKGDNFILGTYDKKILWFDMDMSGEKPYKQMKYHDKAIRDVQFSPKYPLFASASDDGSVNIFYGMVYNDLTQNALVVPVKVLKAHQHNGKSGLGAMGCCWHPSQPWVFTAGVDGKIKLWV